MLPPPTPQPPPKSPTPTWAVILLFLIVLVIAAGTGVLARSQWILPPIDAASTSPPSSASVSSGRVYEATASAADATMAASLSTLVAPTSTPLPTPTPEPTYAVATTIPDVICGSAWVNMGEVCVMPPAPKPTPTPIPPCPTVPGLECIWNGSLTPQPTPDQPWSPT